MGYGAESLGFVLRYLPAKGSIVELGAQDFHGGSKRSGAAGAWYRANGYEYRCVDIAPNDFGDRVDLNTDMFDGTPADVVTNFGTTEHVMGQVQAFRFVHDACKTGGAMLHQVPATHKDHGLFNYTERFFVLLGQANDYVTDCIERVNEKPEWRVGYRKRSGRGFAIPMDARR